MAKPSGVTLTGDMAVVLEQESRTDSAAIVNRSLFATRIVACKTQCKIDKPGFPIGNSLFAGFQRI